MAWIKRNLFFLIGSLIAVALMVVGIFYLLQQINNESQVTEEIQKQYTELARLAALKPHPGNDKVDNIAAAKDQQESLLKYARKERAVFERIPAIPDSPANKVSNADFSRELRNTVAELRHSAQQQSVELPPDYYFTFEAQRRSLSFEPASLGPLASHLGEIKVICDIFFAAKINTLENIQREIISTNQDTNPSDYLAQRKTVSLPLGELTPYQVTFRCFSADLAQVLASLATSPYGLLVQTIDVEPAVANEEANLNGIPGTNPFGQPPPGYNPNGGHHLGFPGQPQGAPAPAPATPGRPAAFLNEKPFRVTLLIQVIKPKAAVK